MGNSQDCKEMLTFLVERPEIQETGFFIDGDLKPGARTEEACGWCEIFRNPETGEYDPSYIPEGELGVDYDATHGICIDCVPKAYGISKEEFKKTLAKIEAKA